MSKLLVSVISILAFLCLFVSLMACLPMPIQVVVVTATPPATETPTSVPTATSVPTSTPTVVPSSTATPTPTPTATPTPKPTITLTPTPNWVNYFVQPILAAIANKPPTFQDDFSNPDRWWGFMLGRPDSKGTVAFKDGVARINTEQGECYIRHNALDQKDFVLQLDARVAAGDNAGINIFFHNIDYDKGFYLELFSWANVWRVQKGWAGQGGQLARGSDIISPIGEATHVMIIARGARAAIYLNGVPAAYFEDANFDRAGVAMFFCTSTSKSVCEFDNVKIWILGDVPGLP